MKWYVLGVLQTVGVYGMETILLEKKQGLAWVTLNRPDSMNAFNYDMIRELGETIEQIRIDPEVRVVILTGAGDRALSVGADLKERKTLTDMDVKRNLNKIGDVFTMIDQLPQPTIAMINGFAFGGGMELALACDFRFAAMSAVMGLTETGLAIIPGAGGTQRLPRLVGEAKALELILTAQRLSASDAALCGLVTRTVEDAVLKEETQAFADKILANGPIGVQQAKFAIKQGMKADLATGLTIERKAYEITIPTEDRIEALNAFAEKRKPEFKGR